MKLSNSLSIETRIASQTALVGALLTAAKAYEATENWTAFDRKMDDVKIEADYLRELRGIGKVAISEITAN
jgi:hypothetical protein